MFGLDYAKIAVLVGAMVAGGLLVHQLDKGTIEHQKGLVEHQKGLVTEEKLKHETAVREALVWATQKQRSYDDVAITVARTDAARQQDLASDASERVRALQSIQPRTLVRGCITYEFVRHLDAAIIATGAASALPIPAGKHNDTCAPVDAVAVERWILGIIASHQMNAQQLTDLQGFIRQTQALR